MNKDTYKLNDLLSFLQTELKGEVISSNYLLSINDNIDINLDNKIIIKIDDIDTINSLLTENEKSEIQITINHFNEYMSDIKTSSYEYQISTGKLIIIILSGDEYLEEFFMYGNGELLFNHLSKLIGTNLDKSNNYLDEVIDDLNHFRPYGKYFK